MVHPAPSAPDYLLSQSLSTIRSTSSSMAGSQVSNASESVPELDHPVPATELDSGFEMVEGDVSSDDEGAHTPSSASFQGNDNDDAETVTSTTDTELSNAETVESEDDLPGRLLEESFVDIAEDQDNQNNVDDDEEAMRSEVTLVPPTPPQGRRAYGLDDMLHPDSNLASSVTIPETADDVQPDDSRLHEPHYKIAGFKQHIRPYQPSESTVRLLLVTDKGSVSGEHSLVAKLASALFLDSTHRQKEVMVSVLRLPRKQNEKIAGEVDQFLIRLKYEKGSESTTVEVVGRSNLFHHDLDSFDFTVFYHNGTPTPDGRFVYNNAGEKSTLAMVLAARKIPILEVSAGLDPLGYSGDVTKNSGFQHLHLHRSEPLSLQASKHDVVDVPIDLETFTALNERSLNRHLAYLRAPSKPSSSVELWTKTGNKGRWIIASSILIGLLCFSSFFSFLPLASSTPATELALRKEGLDVLLSSLNTRPESLFHGLRADDMLQYPTAVIGSDPDATTVIQRQEIPDIRFVKPNFFFISAPKLGARNRYPSLSIAISRSGGIRYESVYLTSGVWGGVIDKQDANGEISVYVETDNRPPLNNSLTISLGNRLLQKVTYVSAANEVKKVCHKDIDEARLVATAFKEDAIAKSFQVLQSSAFGLQTIGNRTLRAAHLVGNSSFSAAVTAGQGVCHGVLAMDNAARSLGRSAKNVAVAAEQKAMLEVQAVGRAVQGAASSIVSLVTGTKDSVVNSAIKARGNAHALRTKFARNKKTVPPETTVPNLKGSKLHGFFKSTKLSQAIMEMDTSKEEVVRAIKDGQKGTKKVKVRGKGKGEGR